MAVEAALAFLATVPVCTVVRAQSGEPRAARPGSAGAPLGDGDEGVFKDSSLFSKVAAAFRK